jgi:hypothetical protein
MHEDSVDNPEKYSDEPIPITFDKQSEVIIFFKQSYEDLFRNSSLEIPPI